MNTTRFLVLGLAWVILTHCSQPEPNPITAPPPNILLIMGDDMGYSDLGCYGGEINTPNLDALAANGLRFTQFYNTARCCPTRASLLTGLYPQQAGIGHMVNDRGTPAFRGDLSEQAVTIAQVLKGAGYSTYMAGKWHVTPYVVENPDKKNWPRQRGFDKFFGMISGAGSLYDPRSLAEDNEYVAPREGFYCTQDFTDYAIECIEGHEEAEKPFFLYLSYTAAHWPMHAPKEAIAEYKDHYDEGWDVMRAKRYERMKEMNLIDPTWEMTPRDSFVQAWSEDLPDKEWELANMEVYAAMVDYMDAQIGRVVETLKAQGMLENTLIFFLQDNGACAEELQWVNTPDEKDLVPMKPGQLQTLMVPTITRDGKPVKVMKEAWPGPPEGYTAYGLNWANASNTPFREYKHWVHEGGISTPLIVHWPSSIQGNGDFRKEPTHLIDIMATCVDVSGASYPLELNGSSIHAMEGKSLLPAFRDQSLNREAIYWEHEGNRAVRMGKWKLVSKASKKLSFLWDKVGEMELADWELFDMEKDRTEMHDVAGENPELVQQMADMWLAWANRTGAIPRPN